MRCHCYIVLKNVTSEMEIKNVVITKSIVPLSRLACEQRSVFHGVKGHIAFTHRHMETSYYMPMLLLLESTMIIK